MKDQEADWQNRLRGAAMGNPYATLCSHCYGRHKPPFDEQCPHESIADLKARLATTPTKGSASDV